jgi:hypothetical protein
MRRQRQESRYSGIQWKKTRRASSINLPREHAKLAGGEPKCCVGVDIRKYDRKAWFLEGCERFVTRRRPGFLIPWRSGNMLIS